MNNLSSIPTYATGEVKSYRPNDATIPECKIDGNDDIASTIRMAFETQTDVKFKMNALLNGLAQGGGDIEKPRDACSMLEQAQQMFVAAKDCQFMIEKIMRILGCV